MRTNTWYGRLCCFEISCTERRALLVGAKEVLYTISIFIVRVGEIRNDSLHVLLIAWTLSNFIVIRVDEGLIYDGSKWNDIYMCIVKPCALYKCSMFNFFDSYNIKLQSLQLIITTKITLTAHYRSRSPLSYRNCNFPIFSTLKSCKHLMSFIS